jgi:hypothetical protein
VPLFNPTNSANITWSNNTVPANAFMTNAITLGYAAITGNFTTTSSTAVQVTGLTLTVTIPSGGRYVRISSFIRDTYSSASAAWQVSIWNGTVGSGTQLAAMLANNGGGAGVTVPGFVQAVIQPSVGSQTYNIGALTSAGTLTLEAGITYPSFILVEAL